MLRTLRLARNQLADLRDTERLAPLASLTLLTLEGNPLATLEHWREYVLSHVRTLHVLDDAPITSDHVALAVQRFGDQHLRDARLALEQAQMQLKVG